MEDIYSEHYARALESTRHSREAEYLEFTTKDRLEPLCKSLRRVVSISAEGKSIHSQDQ